MKKDAMAIIPARGGSKRIPKKNIKEFHGLPLISYSIKAAINSNLFEKVVVTTDDEAIAKVAKEYGADVPFLRPKELSDDFTGTVDVVNHAVEYLESQGETYKYICTIYATAPFLQSNYLKEGYEKLKNSDAINAFSATSMPFPIQRTFKLDNNGRCEMFTPEHYMSRSQDLEEAYQDAGQFYWTARSRQKLSQNQVVFSDISIPIILPRHLVQDIDTIEDWTRAEYMYQALFQDEFDKWNNVKKKIDISTPVPFHQGQIYFMSVGKNVGYEVYGKKELFLRPVLVYRKLSTTTFIGIPLSSKFKEGNYYFTFRYTQKTLSTALLNQIKVFDIKRALYHDGDIKIKDYAKLRDQLKELLDITPNRKWKGSGHASNKLPKDNIIISKRDGNVK